MKQVLLLVAVYALIVNQTTKNPAKVIKKADTVKKTEALQASVRQGRPQPHNIVAPLFSYSSIRFITNYVPANTLNVQVAK